MVNDLSFSRQEQLLSKALNCPPNLIQSLWFELELDNYENVHDLKELKNITSTLDKMISLTERLNELQSGLPEEEKSRQSIEGDCISKAINQLEVELKDLKAHRKDVLARNSTQGGKDYRAHQLAEFVARIFEATGRPITFGHQDNEPTTDFCRSVKRC